MFGAQRCNLTLLSHHKFRLCIPPPTYSHALAQQISRLTLLSVLSMTVLLSACQDEAISTSSAALELPAEPSYDKVLTPVQTVDGTEYYQRALTFRAAVQDWRDGNLTARTTYTGEELSDELSNVYNMLWGNSSATFTRQEMLLDSIPVAAVSSYGAVASFEAYEGVRILIEEALARYDDDGSGYRFVYVSAPKEKVTGTYLEVFAQVGDQGSTGLGGRSQEQAWGSATIDPNPGCQTTIENNEFIQSTVNNGLAARATVNPDGSASDRTDDQNDQRIVVDGSAIISFIVDPRPGLADPNDLVLPLRRFARGTGPLFPSSVGVQTGTFPNAGQYLVHASKGGDELCFSGTKANQYVDDHNYLGDNVVRDEWQAFTGQQGQEYVRVGAAVFSGYNSEANGALEFRRHLARFFYGRVIDLDGEEFPNEFEF